MTGGVPSSGDPPQYFGAGDDVEGPVEPAAVRNRVDVTADENRALGLALKREPLVAGGVDRLMGCRLDRALAKPFTSALPRVRPRDPLGAVVVPGELA